MNKLMKKLEITALLMLAPCFSASCLRGAEGVVERPNIVLIMADDMGYGDSSVYDGWIKTPQMERMAREGLVFTDFHSSGVVCSPHRAGLVTGRYQQAMTPSSIPCTMDSTSSGALSAGILITSRTMTGWRRTTGGMDWKRSRKQVT